MKKPILLLSLFTLYSSLFGGASAAVGLQLYSLRDDIGKNAENIDAVLAAVARMGYKYVETASYNDGKIYGMEPAVFAEKLRANGLFAVSTHVNRWLAKNPSETNWDAIWAWWDKCIATHKAAGMTYIVMPAMPRLTELADIKIWCDYFNKIGEKCKAAGLNFGIHNHAHQFETKLPCGLTLYEYMLQNTDPEKVHFQMDVYWVVMGRHSPVELFKKYPGRFHTLHIKDHKELGQSGMVGFDAIFRNLHLSGARHLIVEVEHYTMPPLESVKASLDYLLTAPFLKSGIRD